MKQTEKFIEPELSANDVEFCKLYCPASAKLNYGNWNKGLWGHVESAYYGFSNNEDVRYRASSGGALTAISSYLLDKHIVDGVIHSVSDTEHPWRTKTVCSKTVFELEETCGSRYAQSSPLKDILNLTRENGKYAFIGKPCDVLALKRFVNDNQELKDKIICCLTFFCAGVPSEAANIKLIETLGFTTVNCKKLSYRGNGWPGFATVVGKDGTENKMDYNSSWGKILGRDIRRICRFCMVGTGEVSDVVCGDAWYLGEDGYPDFSEHDGRNIILSRTVTGKTIVEKSIDAGYLCVKEYNWKPELEKMNPFQYERKGTHVQKVLAMKLFNKRVPYDSILMLHKLENHVTQKRKWAIFKGTIGRIVRKKI